MRQAFKGARCQGAQSVFLLMEERSLPELFGQTSFVCLESTSSPLFYLVVPPSFLSTYPK